MRYPFIAWAFLCVPSAAQALGITTTAYGTYGVFATSAIYPPGYNQMQNGTPFSTSGGLGAGTLFGYGAVVGYTESIGSSQVAMDLNELYFATIFGSYCLAGSSQGGYTQAPHAVLVTVTGPPAAAGILTLEVVATGAFNGGAPPGHLRTSFDVHNDSSIELATTSIANARVDLPAPLDAAGSLVVRIATDCVVDGYVRFDVRLAWRSAPVSLPTFGTPCGFAASGSLDLTAGAWQATFQASLPYLAPIVLAVAGLQQQQQLLPGGCPLLVSPDATWLQTATSAMTLPLSLPATVIGTLQLQFLAMPPTGPFRLDASNGVTLVLPL